MRVLWLCLATVCMVVCTAERGGSLRGALEALQRRQRGRVHVPVESSDYEAFYDFVPPQAYPEPDYSVDPENADDETSPKYIVRLLENERPSEAYEYKIIKKKSAYSRPNSNTRQPSPFRERSQHSDNDRLRDLFMDRDEDVEENSHILENEGDNDIEYAVLLDQLWSKYKNNQGRSKNEDNAEGVVKLYKDKIIKKRFPNNWGPVAFKRKRSPESNMDRSVLTESEYIKNNGDIVPRNSNYNSYEVSDNDDDNDKDDMREEYAIAFQPLNDDSLSDLADEDQYAYETIEKRFPVTKRSSEPYNFNSQKKRFAPDQNKRDTKTFRNSAGTDPKIIRDLSKIFGNAENEFIKSPVKRNTDHVEKLHDSKPPTLVLPHNHTVHDHNLTMYEDNSHEEKEHKIHPPGVSGKEEHYHNTHESEHTHDKDHKHNQDKDQHENDNNQETEKPIKIKKKSIDWSDYFGIDKRLKKSVSFVNNLNEDRLKKQYFDTFNKEVIYPLNSFRKNNYAKRNYVQPNEETNIRMNNDHSLAKDEKRNSGTDNESKLDNIDKKLKNMEGIIVDEALHYSNIGEELDSKEEQEMKEKLLSRLAAAYSLEKMRKALKEFKQSLQMQKASSVVRSSSDHTSDKYKRVVIKKEKVLMPNDIPIAPEKNDDFEDEQGAGHYLNGKMEEQLSEGYMGGSGSHHTPVMSTVSSMGACPVLAKIVQRCRGVDLLAGDRGQLFLPLCSLHQICYLCGEAPPTTCDLVFLSEADSSCEGDMSCQRAARSALMALRELHENLVDELDGECEASPCLPATLKLNLGWQRALHRLVRSPAMANNSGSARGVDNPAATEDDGSTLRPDLVISVQPQVQESNRAELPVSTTDWQSNSRGQFISLHGLDFLIGASSLLIQQTVELDDLTSGINSENRYIVKVPHGESLYIASEVSSKTQRNLCGMGRAFVMHLHDSTRQEALVLQRRLAAASCLFPCRLQEMRVITPPGDYIGRIQQQWTWMVPFFLVRDAADDVLYVVEGPAVLKKSALQLSKFKILSGDSLREVGTISHGWDRELVAFTTNIIYPTDTAQPKHKALLLAAAFLLEYTYFERAKKSCWRCNCC
ncbi:uncharacterized protein LOC113393760 [Vanessa tameamea]|uniref:Uncharacterized protein LOC113393760 n=1 Tax=Vanessa tameamea TaxID=334116 RepID=A0A8B8HP19_VANTA